ncbi:MAG: thiamine pyrophosphate-dependent enzyme [Bacillota bacterium]
MPKSQFINPTELLASSTISFKDIDVNKYNLCSKESCAKFESLELYSMLESMLCLREAETVIKEIKDNNGYYGYKHKYNGPAHLSIGQEASAVGQAFALNNDDVIFGSHRCHGELIAKGMRSIELLDDNSLMRIMENVNCGDNLRIIEAHSSGVSVKELAKDFLIYGALSEIFSKSTGFQKGMSGSMHVFFAPFGIYPNNAIVGGAAPIATGASLFNMVNERGGIVVSNTGDGAMGCGVLYESMNFASMDQYKYLWNKNGGLPIIFAISDNGYGMGGQTRGETMGYDMLARVGAGITPSQMFAERIDGNNLFAVVDAYRRKKSGIQRGETPVLLDVVTYRLEGHSMSDNMSYREQQEIEAWSQKDPIAKFKREITESGAVDALSVKKLERNVVERLINITKLVTDDNISPYFDMIKQPKYLEGLRFSNNNKVELAQKSNVLAEKSASPRVQELNLLSRKDITIRDSIFEAIVDKFYEDPTLIAYGEEVRDWGGICGVYRGLTELLPYSRLFNTPISEAAIVSSSIGYAFMGGRAIIEIMFADFMARAGDEILNQLAKWHTMSAGQFSLPIVVRVSIGQKYGTQHSQDWTALVAHVPGLKVVYGATPYDCKGLMNSCLADSNPIIFFESQSLYNQKEIFEKEGVPKDQYYIEIGKGDIKVSGGDVTIVTLGAALYRAYDAVKELNAMGVSAELIDMRSVVPFDISIVEDSVKKTGKLLMVTDAVVRCSIMEDIAYRVSQSCFGSLQKAPKILGGADSVIPPYEYNKHYFPQTEGIVSEVLELLDR